MSHLERYLDFRFNTAFNPYCEKEYTMPLALRDVLKARELNNLCEEHMQYSGLVSVYRRLSQDQLEKVSCLVGPLPPLNGIDLPSY